jgi:hypothetical protein
MAEYFNPFVVAPNIQNVRIPFLARRQAVLRASSYLQPLEKITWKVPLSFTSRHNSKLPTLSTPYNVSSLETVFEECNK